MYQVLLEIIKDVKIYVAVTKMHLFLDAKIISELPKSSKKCFASLSVYSNMSSRTSFFLVSEFLRMLLWKSLGTFQRSDAMWIFSDWPLLIDNCSELLIDSVLYQSAIMSTVLQTFGVRFTNNSANSAYVDDLFRMVVIKAVMSTTIAYSWRGCGPSLVWSSSSCSIISFNLLFAACRRVLSGFQMVKGTWERECDRVLLKSTGFPVFKF